MANHMCLSLFFLRNDFFVLRYTFTKSESTEYTSYNIFVLKFVKVLYTHSTYISVSMEPCFLTQ